MSLTIPVDPRDKRIKASSLHHAALQYIEQHGAQFLDNEQLLRACVTELVAIHDAGDAHVATTAAVSALAEIQNRTRPAWVDISLSTSEVVRVLDPVSQRVALFTASELVSLAEEREAARAGTSSAARARPLKRDVH